MGRMLAIVGSTLLFAVIGLAVAYLAVENIPERDYGGKDEDVVIALSVVPPLLGTLLGLIVGCFAAWLTGKTRV